MCDSIDGLVHSSFSSLVTTVKLDVVFNVLLNLTSSFFKVLNLRLELLLFKF